jgi:prophage regulatory protein
MEEFVMRTRSWRVQLASVSGALPPGDPEFVERFARVIRRNKRLAGPSVSADLLLQRLFLTTCVDADRSDPEDALRVATGAFYAASGDARRTDDVVTIGEILVDIDMGEANEDRQELLGTPEIAERLGVSRERIRQLVNTPGAFPVPAGRVRDTHVWRWGEIADWLALDRRRKPGRPRKNVEVEDKAVYRKLRRKRLSLA